MHNNKTNEKGVNMYNDISEILRSIGSAAAAVAVGNITNYSTNEPMRLSTGSMEIVDYGVQANAILCGSKKPTCRLHLPGDVG